MIENHNRRLNAAHDLYPHCPLWIFVPSFALNSLHQNWNLEFRLNYLKIRSYFFDGRQLLNLEKNEKIDLNSLNKTYNYLNDLPIVLVICSAGYSIETALLA